MNARVSVIIPAYNRASTIKACIESVFAQTYSPLEIVVVDDGSTDGTLAVLQEYKDKIVLVSQKNAGPSAARNTGVRASSGEIVMFLDSDDLWAPDKTAKQVALLDQVPDAICCVCSARLVFATKPPSTSFDDALLKPGSDEGIWTNPAEVLATRFFLFNQVVAVRRSAWQQVGGFCESYRLLEDYDLALRLAVAGKWVYRTEALATWHQGSVNSLSAAARQVDIVKRLQEIFTKSADALAQAGVDQRLITFRLEELRARLSALSAERGESFFGRLAGKARLGVLRVRLALFRRSALFPKMITRPVAPGR